MGDKFVGVLGIMKCIAHLLSGSVTCGSEILAMFEEARTNFYFLLITELLFLLTLLYFSLSSTSTSVMFLATFMS